MHITILAFGSRGDTQPYVALGLALQRAGHVVRLCAGDEFAAFVTAYGLDYVPAGVNFREFEDQHMQAILDTGRNTIKALRDLAREGQPFIARLRRAAEASSAGADALLTNLVGGVFGWELAAARAIPHLMAFQQPFLTRTRALPSAVLPLPYTGSGALNWLSHIALEPLMGRLFGLPVRDLHRRRVPFLYAISPAVIPRPPDWGTHVYQPGYWFLDHAPDWQPPADLVAFLEAGPPPVYIGFGSMCSRRPQATTRIALDAARRAGQRLVLATGWHALETDSVPDDVFVLDACPHDWLFPRVAAVVHHGGAGTTAAGLRAGKPGVIVPFFGDQPFWGDRVHRLGVGTRPIPRQRLTADRLAFALREATTRRRLVERADALGACIRAEDGLAQAVRCIESVEG
jgi:sterol 3beta-glucosyltransferase